MKTSTLCKALLLLPAMFACTLATAQDTTGITEDELTIEEVIVTAQKREQNMQDVGIAVSSFSNADMHELGFLRPEDLAGQTPGLDIKNALGALNPVFTLPVPITSQHLHTIRRVKSRDKRPFAGSACVGIGRTSWQLPGNRPTHYSSRYPAVALAPG